MDKTLVQRDLQTMISYLRMALMVGCVLVAGAARADGPEGTYQGTVGGQRIMLELRSGGNAVVAGEAGRWVSRGNAIEVADGDGNVYAGQINGNAIVFVVEGTQVRFERQGGKPSANKTPAYSPNKVLKGKRITPEGSTLSIVVPSGWKGAWDSSSGSEVYTLSTSAKDKAILVSARQLSAAESNKSMASLLRGWSGGLAQGRDIEASRDVSVGRRPAALWVVETKDKPAKQVAIAAVRMDGWAVVFVGIYAATDASGGRAAFDTVFTSVGGKPATAAPSPAAGGDSAAAQQLAHCWRSMSSAGSGGGSTTRVTFHPNGSYEWSTSSSFGSAGGSVNKEVGAWIMVKNTHVKMTPNDGSQVVTWSVGMNGSALILNGIKYYRCD